MSKVGEIEGVAVVEMPRYRCHKKVWALKIKEVHPMHPGADMSAAPTHVDLVFEDSDYAHRLEKIAGKPMPESGWYWVQYPDGYVSFSPSATFEEGYHRLSGSNENHSMVSQAAKMCHEANRAYCETLGDFTQLPWEAAPEWQQKSAVLGVELHLTELREGRTPMPQASHESWLKQKREEGWQYGPVKDAEAKLHPCFVPYDALSLEQQAKDFLFVGVVTSLFNAGVLK